MVTIIYYTSDLEDPIFEVKILKNIKQSGLPIIEVHRTEPPSYLTAWKQLLTGLKQATTKFCLAAESDCWYPPEYFTFTPPREDLVYRYDNVWVKWADRKGYYKKYRCEGAQMCGREYWIERLEKALEYKEPREIAKQMFPSEGKWTGDPVITFKTGKGISNITGYIKGSKINEPVFNNQSTYAHWRGFASADTD